MGHFTDWTTLVPQQHQKFKCYIIGRFNFGRKSKNCGSLYASSSFFPQNTGCLLCERSWSFAENPFEDPVRQLTVSTQRPEEGGGRSAFMLLSPPVSCGPFPGSADAGCTLRGPAPPAESGATGPVVPVWPEAGRGCDFTLDHAPPCLGARGLCPVGLRVGSVPLPSLLELKEEAGGAGAGQGCRQRVAGSGSALFPRVGSQRFGHRGCESRFPVH